MLSEVRDMALAMLTLRGIGTFAATSAALGVLYLVSRALYNVCLHPLARFPGPKLAAASDLWEQYYAFFYRGGGCFSDVLYELHQRYGPIVRISPTEVHILDRNMYDKLFNFDSELDKRAVNTSTLQHSPSFELHRRRRKSFDPFFSKASISKIEPLLYSSVEKLCDRIREAGGAGAVVKLSLFYRCLTFDIISDYMLAEGFGLLDEPQSHEDFINAILSVFKILPLMLINPIVAMSIMLLRSVPRWLQFSPSGHGMNFVKLWQDDLEPKVRDIVTGNFTKTWKTHPIFIEEYLKNPAVPADERTEARLRDNVQMFVGAGLEATGFSLSLATYELITHPTLLATLRKELDTVWPADGTLPPMHSLERLPFLTAVIKESLRMSIGVMSRLHRVNHHRAMESNEWTIPPGTFVSMSQRFILGDHEIFPDPKEFKPDRWLQGENSKLCDKWLVSFSRGARNCIGVNLAWAELYLTLATIVHCFDFELFETDNLDVLPARDFFIPMPVRERGVRVTLKNNTKG